MGENLVSFRSPDRPGPRGGRQTAIREPAPSRQLISAKTKTAIRLSLLRKQACPPKSVDKMANTRAFSRPECSRPSIRGVGRAEGPGPA
jgi:hypothetical protein